MKFILFPVLAVSSVLLLSSCKKDDDNDPVEENLDQQIINDFSSKVAYTSYTELAMGTNEMYQNIQAFRNNPTANGLNQCRQDWRDVRKVWEQTEAYLFGPAATEEIDPRIDTWPVNFNDLETLMASSDPLTEAYVNSLDDALKGFHPAEYLLFGEDGTKTFIDFTPREFEFLEALALNLKNLTSQLSTGWSPAINTSFYYDFTKAGSGSTVYASKKAALEEMVGAMAGICDEVANGKMNEPFIAMDPSLEESPYAKNSLIDFTNNIKGVQNVYLGKYVTDGIALEDFVRQHNLSLDATIKLQINNAITALNNISVPFGEAILSQPVQVQNAIDAINLLQETIDENLLPLVQLHVH